MPSKRVRTRRPRRRTFRKRRLATKAFVKKELHKAIETKYNDETFSQFVDWNGQFQNVTGGISQGITDTQRIGDKIRIRGIQVEGWCTVADTTNLVRICVFQWKQNNALVAPASNYIIQYTGSGIAPMSPFNNDLQGGNYVMLYTRVLKLVSGTDKSIVRFRFRVPMKYCKRLVEFYVAGTQGTNHIYMMGISDSGAPAHPNLFMMARVWYEDA